MVQEKIRVLLELSHNNIITYNEEDIVKFQIGSRNNSDSETINIGTVARYGSLVLKDKNEYLLNLSNASLLSSNVTISIYKGNYFLGKYVSTVNWKYNYTKNQVEIEFKSRIVEWSDIYIIKGIPYSENVTGTTLLNSLISLSLKDNETFEDVFEQPTQDLKHYLDNIKISKMFLPPDFLNNLWNKFCNFALLTVFENDNGKIEIRRF